MKPVVVQMRNVILRIRIVLILFALLATGTTISHASSFQDQTAPEETPKAFTLSSAYPNPFNPSTTFTLTVRERQELKVEIYNMLGKPVRELFSGVMEADESRSFTFNAGDLPSGIYFYRVTAEKFTAARQVTLIK